LELGAGLGARVRAGPAGLGPLGDRLGAGLGARLKHGSGGLELGFKLGTGLQ
jgi:hypothetical protein